MLLFSLYINSVKKITTHIFNFLFFLIFFLFFAINWVPYEQRVFFVLHILYSNPISQFIYSSTANNQVNANKASSCSDHCSHTASGGS